MQKVIRHRFTLARAPERVWEYLIRSELLAQWLMPNDFKPIVGHTFQFGTRPKLKLGFDGRIYGEVLEAIPYQKLVYSWQGGLSKEKPSLDSTVTWTLAADENGTLLTLEHQGFKGIRNYLPYLIMNKGWLKIGRRLSKQIQSES